MKKLIVLTAVFLIGSVAVFAQDKGNKKDTTMHPVVYTCPMHPDVKSDKPGKCPKCGMDLVEKKKSGRKMSKDSTKMKMNS